jgi:hypothetical protein
MGDEQSETARTVLEQMADLQKDFEEFENIKNNWQKL